MNLYFEICGWVGAAILLAAYFLSTFKSEKISKTQYVWLNLIASLFLAINAIYYVSYPFILVNSFWAIISVIKLLQVRKRDKYME